MNVAIVLCWNDAGRVLELLARLPQLDPAPDAVVVVDNGSTGGDASAVERAHPFTEVLRLERNFGYAVAANHGIRRALELGAERVWLLNSDIELPDRALAALVAAFGDDESGPVGLAAPVLVERDGRVQARGGGRVSLRTGVARHVVRRDEPPDYLSGACLLASAALLRDIGLFDEGSFFSWEDVDLGFRAREAGWRLAVAEDCLVVHDEGSTLGRWSAARWERLFEGMFRFLARRAPRPRTASVLRLAIHTATMLRHGRVDAVRGAWRAATAAVRSGFPSGAGERTRAMSRG